MPGNAWYRGYSDAATAELDRCRSGCGRAAACHDPCMSSDVAVDVSTVDVSVMAINVTIPEALRWTDTRRGEEFLLTTLNVRRLPDGRLAAKAYGRPTAGGRGTYVSFPVPDRAELVDLVSRAADRAGELWTAHRGLA